MRFYKAICLAVAVGLAGMSTLANAETWRFGLEEIEGSVQYEYANEFKKIIEEKSGGDVTVQILPYGKWGSSYSALYDAIQNGAIQIGFGSGFLGGTVPESQLMSLNFIMPSDELETAKVLNSDAFLKSDAWQQAFRERGLVPIAELPEGYQVWTANKPIHTPADMQGLAIRVMDNSLLRATYKAYGASPTSVAYGELYSALQQGQADANIQPVFAQHPAFQRTTLDLYLGNEADDRKIAYSVEAAALPLPPRSCQEIVAYISRFYTFDDSLEKQGVCDHPEDREEWRRLLAWLTA